MKKITVVVTIFMVLLTFSGCFFSKSGLSEIGEETVGGSPVVAEYNVEEILIDYYNDIDKLDNFIKLVATDSRAFSAEVYSIEPLRIVSRLFGYLPLHTRLELNIFYYNPLSILMKTVK